MSNRETATSKDRRDYIRIRTVFPVVLSVLNGSDTPVKKIQGFTRDISLGGICLQVNALEDSLAGLFSEHKRFHVQMEVPFQKDPISVEAHLRWCEKQEVSVGQRFELGLQFSDMSEALRSKLIRYSRHNRRQPFFWAWVFSALFFTLGLVFVEYKQVQKNWGSTLSVLGKTEFALQKAREERESWEARWRAFSREKNLLEERLKKTTEGQKRLEARLKEMEGLKKAEQEAEDARHKAAEMLESKWVLEAELKKLKEDKKSLESALEKQRGQEAMLEQQKPIPASADGSIYRVLLNDGEQWTGILIGQTDSTLEFKVGKGTLILSRSDVLKTEKQSPLNQTELEACWQQEKKVAQQKMLEEERVQSTSLPFSSQTSGIALKDRKIWLGGVPYFVKGMAYGIEYPKTPGGMKSFSKIPKEVFEKDFSMMEKIGVNTIRTYEPLNQELLDLAWKHHLRVIENVCYPNGLTDFSSPVHLKHHLEKALEAVRAHKNHPAILMWSLWNDAPWPWDVGGSPFGHFDFETVDHFMKQIYDAVKNTDPTHPVTASNVPGFSGSELGFSFLDVLGFNAYLGGIGGYVQEDADNLMKELEALSEKHDKPVLILETGFSTFVPNMDQETVLLSQFKTAGTRLAGITVFQWADGWNKAGFIDRQDENIEEHWGIVTGYREPKAGYKAVAKAFGS